MYWGVSFENMKTPARRRAVESVGSILAAVFGCPGCGCPYQDGCTCGPGETTAVTVPADDFFRLMEEHGVRAGSGLYIPAQVVTPKAR